MWFSLLYNLEVKANSDNVKGFSPAAPQGPGPLLAPAGGTRARIEGGAPLLTPPALRWQTNYSHWGRSASKLWLWKSLVRTYEAGGSAKNPAFKNTMRCICVLPKEDDKQHLQKWKNESKTQEQRNIGEHVFETFRKETWTSNKCIFFIHFPPYFQLPSVVVSLLWPRHRGERSILKSYF